MQPVLNLLKYEVFGVPNTSIVELCDTARKHLDIMYDVAELSDTDMLNFRAQIIVKWLYDTHPLRHGTKVLVGDISNLRLPLIIKLREYGFIPYVPLNVPNIIVNMLDYECYHVDDIDVVKA